MTVNQKIVYALRPFRIPVVADFFGDGNEEYFTFDLIDERGEDFGDNEPQAVVVNAKIHWFLPMDKNYPDIKEKIKKALFQAGFTYPTVDISVDPESNIRHILFDCEIENDDELGE